MTTMIDESVQVKTPVIEAALLTSEQAWTLCGLSKSCWYKKIATGCIPHPVKIGGALRWRRDELLHWIEAGCPPRQEWDAMNLPATKSGKRG